MSQHELELERFRNEWQQEVLRKRQRGEGREEVRTVDVRTAEAKTDGEPEVITVDSSEVETHNEAISEKETEITTLITELDLNKLIPQNAQEAAAAIKEDLATRRGKALRIYEAAVEKERVGKLADALKFYRQALRLHDGVDKEYKNKHFPTITEPEVARPEEPDAAGVAGEPEESDEPEEECLLLKLPNEVLNLILRSLALMDLSSFTKASYACQKLAFLAHSDTHTWRALCMQTYTRMVYNEAVDESAIIKAYPSYRAMFRDRPRISFNGIYISTCNYQRYGVADSWNVPIHIVTYYRYVRFYPDGTCISTLSTREPAEVVPEFDRNSMRPGMFRGTWSMSLQGHVRIQSQAPVVKYVFEQELDVRSSGRGRHNRLNWATFWSVNRATAERFEFSLQHDKPFYFSRVLSYKE